MTTTSEPHVHAWPMLDGEEQISVRRVRWCTECGRTELRDEFGRWHRYVTADDLDVIEAALSWYKLEAAAMAEAARLKSAVRMTAGVQVLALDAGNRAQNALRVLRREEVIINAKQLEKRAPARQAADGNDRRSAAHLRDSNSDAEPDGES